MIRLFITIIITASFLTGCGNSNSKKTTSEGERGTVDSNHSNSATLNEDSNDLANGENLFKNNCAVCHMAPYKDGENGPGLRTFLRSLNNDSISSIVSYISNSSSSNTGFKNYVAKFNNTKNLTYEHKFIDSLSDSEISSISKYIWEASKK